MRSGSAGSAPWSACSPSPPGRKCPGGSLPGRSSAYSPLPMSFTTARERSGNLSGSAWRRRARKASRATASGSSGSRSPAPDASCTMRSQRSGERRTRRSDGKPLRFEVGRGDAVRRDHEVLDELLGPVLSIRVEIRQLVSVEDRLCLGRLQAERAVAVPQFNEPLRHAVLEAEVLVEARGLQDAGRRRAFAIQPRRHASVGELPWLRTRAR